jgi:hypothetical protein
MYVHLKKKHNIGMEELKNGYRNYIYLNFLEKRNKISTIDLLTKVRQKTNYKNFDEKFEFVFKQVFEDVYIENNNQYSEFYDNFYGKEFRCHPLFNQILDMYKIFRDKELLDKLKNTDLIKNMDMAISVYVFGFWTFNSKDDNFKNLKISILFREFLNFIGWDHLKQLASYNIVDDYSSEKDEYSKVMLAENLPELLDDFVGVFIKETAPGLGSELYLVKNYISEFCNFLYNEGIINYMIEPID